MTVRNVIFSLMLAFFFNTSHAGSVISVYYFPGWEGSEAWGKLDAYKLRTPLIGQYYDNSVPVIKKQMQEMSDYGIDVVFFDWYWNGGHLALQGPINNFANIARSSNVKFSVMLANHESLPTSLDDFDLMVNYWLLNYFNSGNYFKIDGKPVVVIFSPENLQFSANKFSFTTRDLFSRANLLAKTRGFPGIYFVAVSHAVSMWVNVSLRQYGYSAVTGYNYHFALSGEYDANSPPKAAHSYRELMKDYNTTWTWFRDNSELPYWPSVISGWDRRPWGGSADPKHDNCASTPEEFLQHIRSLKKLIDTSNSNKFGRVVTICCWNEFGEGSYIEPTVGTGFSYLSSIKKVFH